MRIVKLRDSDRSFVSISSLLAPRGFCSTIPSSHYSYSRLTAAAAAADVLGTIYVYKFIFIASLIDSVRCVPRVSYMLMTDYTLLSNINK